MSQRLRQTNPTRAFQNAFTLIELMIVVTLIGIIAAFAIPNYQKSIRKQHERDAIIQLTTIHAANEIYNAQTGEYLTGNYGLNGINSNLQIHVLANGMIYLYDDLGSIGASYEATATLDDATPFTIKLNNNPIGSGNPCCDTGGADCPSLPDC